MKRPSIRISITIIVIIIALTGVMFSFGESDLQRNVMGKSMSELMDKGREYYRTNKLDSAMLMFTIVADKYDGRLSPEEKELAVLAMNNVGTISNFNYLDFVRAYNYMSRALDLSREFGWTSTEAIVCLNMAELFMLYSKHLETDSFRAKALEYSKKGFKKAYESGNYECMAAVLVNLFQFDLTTPTEPFRAIFNTEIPSTTPYVAYARSIVKAADAFQQRRMQQARVIFSQSVPLVNSKWEPERELISYPYCVALTYLTEGNIHEAEKWFLSALSKADSLGKIDQQLDILQKLSTLSGDTGKKYKIRYWEKKDSVITSGKLAMVGELDFLNSLKKEQAKAAELSESRSKLLIMLGIGGTILAIVIVFTVTVTRLNARLRERNRALYLRIRSRTDTPSSPMLCSHSPQSTPASSSESTCKYSGQNLSEEKIDEIYREVENVIKNTNIICSQEFNLSKLAAMINVNTTYVSRVINEKAGCSFSAFVNERRILIACQRLDDHQNYGNMTIEAISKSVGFASRNTFVNAFKKVNGMTPSEYLKISREVNAR